MRVGHMSWHDEVVVEPVGDRRFRARVDESWTALQGVNGGIVAALALEAVETVLRNEGVEPSTTLRAATLGYVSGTSVGELTIDVDLVRRGRSLITAHARTTQEGKTTAVARFHHSAPWDGVAYSDAPPMPARPGGTVRIDTTWELPSHISKVETHLHPDTPAFGGAARAEWLAWSRPLEGGTFDATWLTMYGDYFPPAVFTRASGPSRAVTVEYAIQIHSGTGRWTLGDGDFLTARFHAFHSHDGFAVEDGWIYLPDGSLLATTRQVRLAG